MDELLTTCNMVSLMQALATPPSTVHKTKYLDTYHENISFGCFFSGGSDVGSYVASGADRYVDITFIQNVGSWKVIPCFSNFLRSV